MVDREDNYKVEVLKNALKSAADERKQLLLQVSELKKQLSRRGPNKGLQGDDAAGCDGGAVTICRVAFHHTFTRA